MIITPLKRCINNHYLYLPGITLDLSRLNGIVKSNVVAFEIRFFQAPVFHYHIFSAKRVKYSIKKYLI